MKLTTETICLLAVLAALAACSQNPEAEVSEAPESIPVMSETAEEKAGEATPSLEPVESEKPVFVHDPTSLVTVLGYHRFEERPRDGLAISPEEFRSHMQAVKDAGIEVISMNDFLAWRRQEKNIPARAALITIDDGYDCTYKSAWPILKEFGYPFTAYVYTNYIGAGGRSIRWEMLEEMRDAGVDIGSHSISHASLTKRGGRSDAEYQAFLEEELAGSKRILEHRLGIRAASFAYAYGNHNEQARKVGQDAGYEALFTVAGSTVTFDTPADRIGRWVIDTKQPNIFKQAIDLRAPGGPSGSAAATAASTAPAFPTTPENRATGVSPRPGLSVTLPSYPPIQPESVEMRISGVGLVPAEFDTQESRVVYTPNRDLLDGEYTVIARASDGERKHEVRWTFTVGRGSPGAGTDPEPADAGAASSPPPANQSEEPIPTF